MATKRSTVLVTGGADTSARCWSRSCSRAVTGSGSSTCSCSATTCCPKHPALELVKADIRDEDALARRPIAGVDAVIHLACISNDPSFELDPSLSKSINYDCFEPTRAPRARRPASGASSTPRPRASTASATRPNVTEDHPLVPLTDYNKYKGMCEPILLRYQSPDFTTVIIRPATVCGYSPRQRLDLTVNILTNHRGQPAARSPSSAAPEAAEHPHRRHRRPLRRAAGLARRA